MIRFTFLVTCCSLIKMKKTLFLTCLGLILYTLSYGQATVKGKVTDGKSGETLIGVTISLAGKPGVGVTTDLDGNYTLILPDASVQTLVVSYISYETKKEVIHPVVGETITKNFILQSVSQELGSVVVESKASREKAYYMENIKKNSSTSIDFISSETMKKTGDVNVTAAIARVSGVSMSSNGFITVRGISDRYVKTTINGSRVPTLDPFTNNLRLDLFPASLIDNVVLTKTASPDLPGDWAGAYISLETKDYPDKFTINMETSFGYNAQTTFKDYVSTQQSSTDWLGYDNGFREYDHQAYVTSSTRGEALKSPQLSIYSQFVGLGLQDYLNSNGITPSLLKAESYDDAYFVLGLVQLGLLDKELQTNKAAVTAAIKKYDTGGYKERAFIGLTKEDVKSSQAFKNNWNPLTRKAPLNFSQSFSIGNKTKLFGRTLGIMAGFRYGRGVQYDPNSTSEQILSITLDTTGGPPTIMKDSVIRQNTKEINTWSALMSLAYSLNLNNKVSFVFMPNYTGVNNVNSQIDYSESEYDRYGKAMFYEHREQMIYQLKSEHFLPGPKMKIDINASYTKGKSNAPDFKTTNYNLQHKSDGTDQFNFNEGDEKARIFRYLRDDVFDSRVSAELPFKNSTDDLLRKLKFGAAYQSNSRKDDQYKYLLLQGDPFNHNVPFNGNMEELLPLEAFDVQTNVDGSLSIPFRYLRDDRPDNHSFGKSTIKAAFLMVDYSITSFMRFSGGIRAEQTDMYTDLVKYDELHLKVNDLRRFDVSRYGNPFINPGQLNKTNYLPSVTLIFKLKKDAMAPINLRANYSQTLARPSLREISSMTLYDFEYRTFVRGNPDLKMTQIKNYDLRFESYFKSGDNVSVSLFYKDFRNHIELSNDNSMVTWQNVDKSNAMGIELEGKKMLLKHLEFRANVTFVKSQTKVVLYEPINGGVLIPVDTIKHPMFGQAPYILNGILTYTADSIGLTLTASYNVQGPRLAITSTRVSIPDIYELPRNLLDFKVSKTLGKYFSISLTIRDILNAKITRAYKFENWDTQYDSYRYGTNFVLGLTYKI